MKTLAIIMETRSRSSDEERSSIFGLPMPVCSEKETAIFVIYTWPSTGQAD